jgi:hypothetical protein
MWRASGLRFLLRRFCVVDRAAPRCSNAHPRVQGFRRFYFSKGARVFEGKENRMKNFLLNTVALFLSLSVACIDW